MKSWYIMYNSSSRRHYYVNENLYKSLEQFNVRVFTLTDR